MKALRTLWVVMATLLSAIGSPDTQAQGCAVPIGGALRDDNDAIWGKLVELAGGKGSRFAVFATAAGNPTQSADRIVETLTRYGAVAEHIPVAPKLAGIDLQDAVKNPELIAKVRASTGVFFTGGEQIRITQSLLGADGKDTPMLAAIRGVQAKGGVIAGTSAGAAVMSTVMFIDVPDILGALQNGIKPGRDTGPGLGFVSNGLLIDQHFLKRGRIGRLLPAMQANHALLGLGVEEDTAAVICGDKVEVVGSKSVVVADLSKSTTDRQVGAFNAKGVRLSLLARGDRWDVTTGAVTPSAAKLKGNKLDPRDKANFKPYHKSTPFFADMLADHALANAMGHLTDSEADETHGLAFRPAATPGSARNLGFSFRLRKGEGTHGYFTSAIGGESYTVIEMVLDVTPVVMSAPLYRALQAPKAK